MVPWKYVLFKIDQIRGADHSDGLEPIPSQLEQGRAGKYGFYSNVNPEA